VISYHPIPRSLRTRGVVSAHELPKMAEPFISKLCFTIQVPDNELLAMSFTSRVEVDEGNIISEIGDGSR
jgi:hypothetical protein